VTSAFRNSFFSDDSSASIASARAGNVIGGGDWAADRLIPDVFRSFQSNEAVLIRNPAATRPWQHVLEPLCGYLKLAQLLYETGSEFAGAWNFGPEDGDVRPVGEVVDYLVRQWEYSPGWVFDSSDQPHEAQLLKLDISKAKAELSWSPRWDIHKALDTIVEWNREFQSGSNMRAITLKQIHDFEKI
jgi:CDP-glucose 4,6-dehydratase